jgi:phosphatidylglycerophosphate synthase
MTVKNVPNFLTALRFPLTILSVIPVLLNVHNIAAFCVFNAAVFLTDFFDGKIARKKGVTTSFGELFDICADIFYTSVLGIVLCCYGIVPVIIIVCELTELFVFLLTSKLSPYKDGKFLVFDYFGRILAVIFYILPLILYVLHESFLSFYKLVTIKINFAVIVFTALVILYRLTLSLKSSNYKLTKG